MAAQKTTDLALDDSDRLSLSDLNPDPRDGRCQIERYLAQIETT